MHVDYIGQYAQGFKFLCCIFQDIQLFWKISRLNLVKERLHTDRKNVELPQILKSLKVTFFNFTFISLQEKK